MTNSQKISCERFWTSHHKIPKKNIIIPLCPSYYMPKNPQNKMSQTALKYYNQFRSVRAKAIRWLQITTDIGKKVKVESESREIYQKLLYFIKIEIIEVEQQKSTENDIINLPMDPIVNISSSKHPMSWELIHRHLLLPNESVMKSISRHKNLTRPPKHPPNNINESSCTVCFTSKTTIFSRGKNVDTTNLQQI